MKRHEYLSAPTVGPKGRVRIVGGLPTCMKVEMVYNVWAPPASGVGMPPPLVGGLFVEIEDVQRGHNY